jgi:hypothetical protein
MTCAGSVVGIARTSAAANAGTTRFAARQMFDAQCRCCCEFVKVDAPSIDCS